MDYYKIKEDWEVCKSLIFELESDIEFFFKRPTSKKWGVLIRKKSREIGSLGEKIKKNIIRQRQDYQSDYS